MKKLFFQIILLFWVCSCGDNSPFDEDYYDQDEEEVSQTIDINENASFTTNLITTSDAFPDLSGTILMSFDSTDVNVQINLNNVPASVSLSHYFLTENDCLTYQQVLTLPSFQSTKVISHSEAGGKDDLVLGLESLGSLVGKQMVIAGVVQDLSFQSLSNWIVPIACGTITE